MAKKILVIEDDVDMQLGLSVRLRASGLEPVFAGDGVTAVAVARKERPDLVLLDLGLPAGDGFVVMERLRNLTQLASVPVVVLTARGAAGNRERCLQAGAAAFLQKPVDNEELLSTIEGLLGKPALA